MQRGCGSSVATYRWPGTLWVGLLQPPCIPFPYGLILTLFPFTLPLLPPPPTHSFYYLPAHAKHSLIPQPCMPQGYSDAEGVRLFKRFIQMARDLPGGIDVREYLQQWFCDAPFERIGGENVAEMLTYGFFYKTRCVRRGVQLILSVACHVVCLAGCFSCSDIMGGCALWGYAVGHHWWQVVSGIPALILRHSSCCD
jgi:hypothetical protein